MTRKTIDIIAGARPNFMKIAPIIRAIEARKSAGSSLDYRLIHTGQHYDSRMSGDFFTQLGIPAPHLNLEVGSGSQATQTAAIMLRYEQALLDHRSDLCMVVWDVTSTMACAIAAQKLQVKVAHVEAGIRSGDWTMPEEINRMVTDAITNYFFTTSEVANANLRDAGIPDDRIFFVGNTMIDTLLHHLRELRPPLFWSDLNLAPREYFVLTLHRPANVDRDKKLTDLLSAVAAGTRGCPVIFPVHPRTKKRLESLTLPAGTDSIHFVDPQGYLEFNYLLKHAKAVITDSGGITEETTVLGIPCMTLRDTTERPETITLGTNELVGTDPEKLGPYFARIFAQQWKQGRIPPFWDGRTSTRIVDHVESLLGCQCMGAA